MKTLVKTFIASFLTATFLTSAVLTTFASESKEKPMVLASSVTYNKIKVSGNIKLVLVQGKKESVEVIEGNYNPETMSIKKFGYTLIINSDETTRITVVVSVKDLQRIDASGSAIVQTDGEFDVKYLQIFLKDNAKANVKANTESAYTCIKGKSNLKLSGSTNDHTLIKDEISKLNVDKFTALKTTSSTNQEMVARNK